MGWPATCMVLATHVTYPRFSFNCRKVICLTNDSLKVSLVLEMKRSCIVSNLEWLIFMSLANSLCGFFKHRTFGSYVQNGDWWYFTHFASRFWFELHEDDLFYKWLHHMNPCTILETLRKSGEVSGNHTKNIAGYYQCWSGIVFFLIPFGYP